MLPFELFSSSWHPPEPIVPFKESPPKFPVAVIGNSEETRPNVVCAVTLYPTPSGMCTRIKENDVFREISRHPLAGRVAVTAIPPF